MHKRGHVAWILVVIIALGAGYWLGHRPVPQRAPVTHPHRIPRLSFALADLNGHIRHLTHWPARLYLVNFWAPWCGPCQAEVPELVTASKQYKAQGLVVIGIALDHKAAVTHFVHTHHVSYPIVLGQEQGFEMLAEYGDMEGAIPFSLFVTAHGRILGGRVGAFTPTSLTADITASLKLVSQK